jgi:hypothetical protein
MVALHCDAELLVPREARQGGWGKPGSQAPDGFTGELVIPACPTLPKPASGRRASSRT